MDNEMNPQQQGPGDVPGMVADKPQASPATPTGPDSHGMETLSDALKGQERDWEASFKGLQTWINKEFNPLRDAVSELTGLVKSFSQPQAQPQPAKAPKPTPAPSSAPAPVSDGNQTPTPAVNPLEAAIQAKRAEQYRDLLIGEYAKPGSPYEGLPLHMFANNIPVHPPDLGEGGALDDSAQRKAIEDFAQTLQGIQGNAQQATEKAMLSGSTPGVSPGVTPPDTAEDVYQEFLKVMESYGSEAFLDLDAGEKADIERRYYELLENPIVQEKHGGSTRPTASITEMEKQLRELGKKYARLESRLPATIR